MSTKHRRKPYMPDSDLGKKAWMERFITQLEKDPERYGFGDPYMFEGVRQTIWTFIKAAQAVASKGQRSHSAVVDKNRAREKAVDLCREIAMRLKWDSSLSDAEKRALGLNIDEAEPEEAKLPAGVLTGSLGYPALAVVSSPNGGHVIRYYDHMSTSKAKPKGVSHLLLYAAIGEKPNMRKTHARLLGAYTKRPFEIMYPVDCGLEGLYVTYFARWLTQRGEMSPWSPGVSKIIAETQVSLRDCPFAHLFGKEGFIDALPEGAVRGKALEGMAQNVVHFDEDRPLLEGVPRQGGAADELFAAIRQLEAATVRMLDAA